MLTALDITAVKDVTLKSDKSPEPTVFGIGYFDLFLRAQMSKELAQMRKASREEAVFVVIKVIRFGLRSWTLKDKNGNPVPLNTQKIEISGVGTYDGLTDPSLNFLEMTWVNELAEKIMRLNYPLGGAIFDEETFAKEHPDLHKKYLVGDAEKNLP
jgi:hypothetical protein